MQTIPRSAALAATVGGAAWAIKFVVITARDGSFEPIESIVFLVGLLGLVATAVLVAVHLTRRLRPVPRAAASAALTVVALAAAGTVLTLVAALVARLYDGGNQGIEQEAGILAVALGLLALGAGRPRAGRSAAGLATRPS